MTLQLVVPISLTDVYAEFGAPLGTPLSAFLRGGAWVPDSAGNAGVPAVLPISLTDLLGASAANLKLTNKTINDDETDPVSALAQVLFQPDGSLDLVGNGSITVPDEWFTSTVTGSLYEVQLTQVVSGDVPTTGAVGAPYQQLNTTRAWAYVISGGILSGVWRFRVREIVNTANFVEADMTISASSVP